MSKVLGSAEVGQALSRPVQCCRSLGSGCAPRPGLSSKVDQAIAEVDAAYEKQIRDDPEVKEAEEQLKVANVEAAKAAEALAAAESDLRKAEADARRRLVAAQMLTLVSGRVDDMTYAKELTTVSIARGDLQKLSQLLREQVGTATAAARPACDR